MRALVLEKGIKAGFALFSQPDIIAHQSNCHQLAHELGKIAYEQSAVAGDAPLTEENTFCEFGFWHGFMDALTRNAKGKNIENAQKICLQVAEKDARLGEENQWSCWHGLGLASVGDPPPLEVWGDARRMAEKAIPFCEEVGTTDVQRAMCAEGAFHSEITYMLNQQYGLSFNLAHPLAFCDAQEKYKKECYREVAPYFPNVIHSMLLADSSFKKNTRFQSAHAVWPLC
jgi:hypothetical protein